MHPSATVCVALLATVALAGCSGDASTSSTGAADTSQAAAAVAGAPTGEGPVITGDAVSNPACALLEVPAVESATGQTIAEVNGTVTAGRYGSDSHNCFWIGGDPATGPWVVAVNLETDAGSAATDAVQGAVDLGAEPVAGLGDLAVASGGSVRAVVGAQYLAVQVSSDAGLPDDPVAVAASLATSTVDGLG